MDKIVFPNGNHQQLCLDRQERVFDLILKKQCSQVIQNSSTNTIESSHQDMGNITLMNPISHCKQEIDNSNQQFNIKSKQLLNSNTNSTCSHCNCEQKKPTLTLVGNVNITIRINALHQPTSMLHTSKLPNPITNSTS